MTPTTVARLFAACSTVSRALRASDRLRARGEAALADALWCHAMVLRATGYPEAQSMYRRQRDQALATLEAE